MDAEKSSLKKIKSKKSSVQRVITDKDGKTREVMMSSEEKEMHDLADEEDEKWKKFCEDEKEKANQTSLFMKLWEYNEPKWFLPVGIIGSMMTGVAFPLFSIYFSNALNFFILPIGVIPYIQE